MSLLLVLVALLDGCNMPSLLIKPVGNTNELEEVTIEPGRGWSPGKVAIIEVEGMLMNARTGRIYDGPDEVHRQVVAKRILKAFANGDGWQFS